MDNTSAYGRARRAEGRLSGLTRHMRRWRRDESGSLTIEFCLWMPVFLAIIVLVLDTSILFAKHTSLMRLTSYVTRQLSVGAMTDAEVTQYIVDQGYSTNDFTATVARPGSEVKLKIDIKVAALEAAGLYSRLGFTDLTVEAVQRDEL
ncbi:hypothetical protein BV394_03705 [Brevirhabdus pacifica]|uniref:TadE-like domain-containing protein n=1 Tax=Brevirhabdus pacifica TaxID=1267768 RepID=A0A1U7DGC3_9RHOB|nr:TadE/TadG family type IV pilus assembly protein [Brevirhabdus pacifica]APX88943.1 hypothetical protein BV394_03705 [Brevirhabdus pacifica]OWU80169.1 hypothetical protein ATO5_04390 [Loktanella sp. 22II-4b]PJJ86504.1 TadE-like protein [Brevirhabdus pacifica]